MTALALPPYSTVLAAEEENDAPALHLMLSGPPREMVGIAVRGALRRVERPGCAALLTTFADAEGRPLAARLEASGFTARQYLANLRFVEGADLPQCQVDRTVAVTHPGSRVVFICGPHFIESMPTRSRAAQLIILHEFLHSLGLGENPPSSREITSIVERHCGD